MNKKRNKFDFRHSFGTFYGDDEEVELTFPVEEPFIGIFGSTATSENGSKSIASIGLIRRTFGRDCATSSTLTSESSGASFGVDEAAATEYKEQEGPLTQTFSSLREPKDSADEPQDEEEYDLSTLEGQISL